MWGLREEHVPQGRSGNHPTSPCAEIAQQARSAVRMTPCCLRLVFSLYFDGSRFLIKSSLQQLIAGISSSSWLSRLCPVACLHPSWCSHCLAHLSSERFHVAASAGIVPPPPTWANHRRCSGPCVGLSSSTGSTCSFPPILTCLSPKPCPVCVVLFTWSYAVPYRYVSWRLCSPVG